MNRIQKLFDLWFDGLIVDATKILIAGAGSIGSVIGALLNNDTSDSKIALMRRRVPFGSIKIQIVGEEHLSEKIRILNYHQAAEFSPDIIIITVQEQQTEELSKVLKEYEILHEDTIIASFQNGLNPITILCNYFPNNPLLQGIIWWSATLINQKVILYHRKASTVVGIPSCSRASENHLNELYSILDNNFEISISTDIETEMRRKLILNIVSPILALTKKPYPEGLQSPSIRNLVHHMFDDALAIAKRLGWDIKDQRLEEFHHILAGNKPLPQSDENRDYNHKVSTQIGIEKYGGKNSNIHELMNIFWKNGSILAKMIVNEVEKLEKNYQPIDNEKIAKLLQVETAECCIETTR